MTWLPPRARPFLHNLLKWLSRLDPSLGQEAKQEASSEEREMRAIRFSNALRVSGEGIKLVISVSEPLNFKFEDLPPDKFSRIRKAVEKEASKIEGYRRYHVDRVVPDGQTLHIDVYGSERVRHPSLLSEPPDNPGERFIIEADAFQEGVRKRLASLLRTNKKAILPRRRELSRSELIRNEKVRVTSSWKPGVGVFISGEPFDVEGSKEALEEDLWGQKVRLEHNKRRLQACVWLIVIIIVAAIGLLWFVRSYYGTVAVAFDDIFIAYIMLYLLLALSFLALWAFQIRGAVKRSREAIRDILTKIDIRTVSDEKEKHAYKSG